MSAALSKRTGAEVRAIKPPTVLSCLRALAIAISIFACSLFARADSLVIEGKDQWLFAGWENLTEANTAGIKKSIDLIREAKDQLAARKIELLVVVVPMKAPFYADRLPASQPISADVVKRYESILAILNEAKIATIDLRESFNRVIADKHAAFYRTDYHWTAWSSEATADQTARAIRERWKLSCKARSGITLGPWKEDRHFGDLANLLPTKRRDEIGEEIFLVRSPASQRNLLESVPNQVQVIGNSFAQPYLGFAQALSNRMDCPVGLTWNYGNVGHWKTFLQFIESAEFKTKKPQVIVWQFNESQLMNGPDAAGQWDAASILLPASWSKRVEAALVN